MATGWLRGTVKAVTSGDCLVIMGNVKSGPPPEKTITLSSLIAPKLARRDTQDEPFAWASREALRKKVVGKEVVFKVDYVVASINREFGSVFLGDSNLALAVVAEGWAKVRPQQGNGDASPYIKELLVLEEDAKVQGVGLWNREPGALAAAVRNLPPSGVGQDSAFDSNAFLESNKGKPLPAIVEHVRDGSTLRVFLLPGFEFVQVYVAGIQAPSMGRRAVSSAEGPQEKLDTGVTASKDGSVNGEPVANGSTPAKDASEGTTPEVSAGPPNAAQRLAASAGKNDGFEAEPFAREAKHFTEVRCLNRDVRVVLEGVDGRYNNLIGSVFYPDGDTATDLALQLVKQGLAKVVDWSANMLEAPAKAALKATELEAKKERVKIWTNFVPPQSNSTAVRDDNFTGKVVEVVSGDCIVVADDAAPSGSPQAERRVVLSSIRVPRMGNSRRDEKPEPYAREAKEFLRTRLIGQQVSVSMEYTRKLPPGEGSTAEGRTMSFGTVLLQQGSKSGDASGDSDSNAAAGPGGNVAEMAVMRGLARVVRHRDFEERSLHYDALLAAEARAVKGKKGLHSQREPPVAHFNDLSDKAATHKARAFLPFLQKVHRLPAVVDYVLSGHRVKLIVPKEMCAIAFALAGVRCPARGEPFSEDAIAFMRRKILQHDVEVEVETVDKTGTFIGSLWDAKHQNVAVALLEAGLARLHPTFAVERTADGLQLQQAEQHAKTARLRVWANYSEEAEASAAAEGATSDLRKGKEEVLQVEVTEVLGGGLLYIVPAGGRMAALEAAMKELQVDKPLAPGSFSPKKGDLVLAQFSADKSWARGTVVSAPKENEAGGGAAEYEIFYIDYGNQEIVPLSRLRPIEASVANEKGLAQLASLAHVKVPELDADFGEEAAEHLAGLVLGGRKLLARIEDRDFTGGKVARSQGVGPRLIVTLVDADTSTTVNAALLQEGLARLEHIGRRDPPWKREAVEKLREHQDVAKLARLNLWQYGDVGSDDEDERPFRR